MSEYNIRINHKPGSDCFGWIQYIMYRSDDQRDAKHPRYLVKCITSRGQCNECRFGNGAKCRYIRDDLYRNVHGMSKFPDYYGSSKTGSQRYRSIAYLRWFYIYVVSDNRWYLDKFAAGYCQREQQRSRDRFVRG